MLEQGSLCRATASTAMNHRSSRSHAVFTITLEQRRVAAQAPALAGGGDSDEEEEGDGGLGRVQRALPWPLLTLLMAAASPATCAASPCGVVRRVWGCVLFCWQC